MKLLLISLHCILGKHHQVHQNSFLLMGLGFMLVEENRFYKLQHNLIYSFKRHKQLQEDNAY